MDVILPDGINLNHELVKQGWCWWYRKYAPGDTVLEGLETAARDARKGLWVGQTQESPPFSVKGNFGRRTEATRPPEAL